MEMGEHCWQGRECREFHGGSLNVSFLVFSATAPRFKGSIPGQQTEEKKKVLLILNQVLRYGGPGRCLGDCVVREGGA